MKTTLNGNPMKEMINKICTNEVFHRIVSGNDCCPIKRIELFSLLKSKFKFNFLL